jgi:dihydrofolate reductase
MRLTVTSHLTLDGVVQSNGKPEPELMDGFEQGGWHVPYPDEEFAGLIGSWVAAADAFLFGRRTYELFVGHWPKVTAPGRRADSPSRSRSPHRQIAPATRRLDPGDWPPAGPEREDLSRKWRCAERSFQKAGVAGP